MASIEGTLEVKHLGEEANQEEETPEVAKSEVEKESPAKEAKHEEEIVEEEDDDEEEEGRAKEIHINNKVEKGAEKKMESSPLTPTVSLRPTRERKPVDRFYATSTARPSATKSLSIDKGQGMQLKDIPNVAYKLSKRKPDENLQILHSILYGKKTKAHNLKKNIGQFSGYVWVESEHEKQRGRVRDKFDKCVKEKLLDFCDVLNLPIKSSAKKEELSVKLLEFLESPHATTDLLLADKIKKSRKQRGKATKTKRSTDKTAEEPAKKQKAQVGEKRKLSSEWNEEADNSSDESQENSENDDAQEESDDDGTDSEDREQKEEREAEEEQNEKMSLNKDSGIKIGDKAAGKDTPVKSSKNYSSLALKKGVADVDSSPKLNGESARRQKVEKDSEEDKNTSAKEKASSRKLAGKPLTKTFKREGKPKNGKANSEPSKEEIHAAAVNILKDADFDTATLSDIIQQLEFHFGVELMHKKAEVKAIVTEVINNMSDDEDETGYDENEE